MFSILPFLPNLSACVDVVGVVFELSDFVFVPSFVVTVVIFVESCFGG